MKGKNVALSKACMNWLHCRTANSDTGNRKFAATDGIVEYSRFRRHLTLILLTWRLWWAPNNARKWQMGFNSALEGLKNTYL